MPNKNHKVNTEYITKSIKPLEDMLTTYRYLLGTPKLVKDEYKNTFTQGEYQGEYLLRAYSLNKGFYVYSTDIEFTLRLFCGIKEVIDYSKRVTSSKSGRIVVKRLIKESEVRSKLLEIALGIKLCS